MYVGSAVVYHIGSLSADTRYKHSMPMMYFLGRNAILFARKHAGILRMFQVMITAGVGSLQRLWRMPSRTQLGGELQFLQGMGDGLVNRNRQRAFQFVPLPTERGET